MPLRSLPLVLLLVLLPPFARAQTSAADVLLEAYQAAEAQFEDIDTYIVTTTMEGAMVLFDSMKVYARKVETEEGYTFDTETEAFGGIAAMANQAGTRGSSPASDLAGINRKMYDLFKDTAGYEGIEQVNGQRAHVVTIDDATPLYQAMQPDAPGADEIQARNARLYIDAGTWVLLQIEMDVTVSDGGESRTMHTVTEMQDYRQIGPMRYPFRMVTRTGSPLSPDERQELEKRRQQMEAQLQQLPEAQRKQLERMLNMSAGMGGDEIEVVVVTKDVQVNVPLPSAATGN